MTSLRRKLHFALAGSALVVWACAEVPVDGTADEGTGDGGSMPDPSGGSSSSPTDPGAETGDTGEGPGGPDTGEASVTAEQVLESLADNVFAPTHAEFSVAADALASAAASTVVARRTASTDSSAPVSGRPRAIRVRANAASSSSGSV